MRAARHHALRPKAADGFSGGIELGKRGEGGIGAAIAVGGIDAGQMNARRRHVGHAELHVSKIVIDAGRVTLDVAVAEVLGEAGHRKQLDLVSRSERFQIVLITLQIDYRVRSHMSGISARKQRLARGRERRRQIYRHSRILEWQGNIGQRVGKKAGCERKRAGDEIVLPQVRND